MEIIPGIPDDLGLQCLIKVPYKFHRNLRAVSKTWNAVLSSPEFYKEREHHNECEEGIVSAWRESPALVFLFIYYPLEKWWEKLPPIPKEFELKWDSCDIVYIRSKRRLLMTGLRNIREDRDCCIMFDFLSRKWLRGAHMHSFKRRVAVSASAEGLVYIAGDVQAYVFNVEENNCETLPRMNPSRPQQYYTGAFFDEKFYVISHPGPSVQVYDPHTRLWKNINIGDTSHVIGCVSAFGGLWWVGWGLDATIIAKQFDFANNSFTTVARSFVPNPVFRCAVVWRDCICLIGMDIIGSPPTWRIPVYYLFNIFETEEEKRLTRIREPAEFPTGYLVSNSAAAVQI